MQNSEKPQQKIDLTQYEIQVVGKSVKLDLNRSFNTAHSSSTTRTNFIIKSFIKTSSFGKIQQKSAINREDQESNSISVGYGQCGLPPKKPYCYLADINDCEAFIKKILDELKSFQQQLQGASLDKNLFLEFFKMIYNQVFSSIFSYESNQTSPDNLSFFKRKFDLLTKVSSASETFSEMYFYMQIFFLFSKAKELSTINHEYKAAKNALEFSLLDLIGQIEGKSVAEIISASQDQLRSTPNHSFYTISHEQNLESMVQNGKDSLKFTDCIKIKFNNEVDKLIDLLVMMDKCQVGSKWIIDANACWSPKNYLYFQQKFTQLVSQNLSIKQKMLFVQQPFPIFKSLKSFKPSEQIIEQQKQWQKIKQSTSLTIIADESFASFEDLDQVLNYSHGINIKMEKCGGPLQAVKTLKQVQKRSIEHLMFGSMVSTHLGCTQTFQFYPFAQYFDIDGALLVKSPEIRGGFEWKGTQGITKIKGKGLALIQNDIDKLF